MHSIISTNEFTSLYRKPTCFKSKNGTCIDLLLTNKHRSFKNTNAFETGMSDFHHMIFTMFRLTSDKSHLLILNTDPISILIVEKYLLILLRTVQTLQAMRIWRKAYLTHMLPLNLRG